MSRLAKYAAFARIGARLAMNDRGEIYGRLLFFAIILGVFSALWRAIAEAGLPVAAEPATLVWYLAATEWILLSPAPVHVGIEGDIRRGDIACQLVRPFSYVAAEAAQGIGRLAVRAPLFAVVAWSGAFVLTGRAPHAHAVALVVPFGLAAMLVIHGFYVITGIAAFWMSDVGPLFWIWQKLLFILGGLMLPLSIYPEWMQRVAAWTPFPFLLAHPASFVISGGTADIWSLTWHLAAWGFFVGFAAQWLFARAVKTLTVNGG